VLFHSPVLTLDTAFLDIHMQGHHPQYKPFIHTYVMFGQRGPATLVFLPFFIWVAWRRRTTEPLVLLVTALILLNLSVGVVKYAIGRVGPAHINDVHMIFAGGNIYPSGHVSNTVVLYGLVAWITPRFRKTFIAVAVFLCATVGMGTVYLRTHWFSDVVGGWIAGALVLLALPSVMPTAQRWSDAAIAWVRRRGGRRTARPPVAIATPARHRVQRKSTPVSSAARPHSATATASSLDALDDRTRIG
jgi:membrane-associated phospholipid phosphatase